MLSLEDGFGKIQHELEMLPHVLSVSLTEAAPLDYQVHVLLSEWDWDTYDRVHEIVDYLARDYVDELSLTADIGIAEDSSSAVFA